MDRFFIIFFNDSFDELGFSLIKIIFILYIILGSTKIDASENFKEKLYKNEINYSYFKYWNPYKRILDFKGEKVSFYGNIYYKVSYNKDKRIRTVTTIDEENNERETYHFLWSKSGLRSEYKVKFHQSGNVDQLDKFLYADQLSLVRKGWIADVKSRNDGRPKEISFIDHLGFTYFYYNIQYPC